MSVPKGTRLRNATMQGHQRGTFEGKGRQLTQIEGKGNPHGEQILCTIDFAQRKEK